MTKVKKWKWPKGISNGVPSMSYRKAKDVKQSVFIVSRLKDAMDSLLAARNAVFSAHAAALGSDSMLKETFCSDLMDFSDEFPQMVKTVRALTNIAGDL